MPSPSTYCAFVVPKKQRSCRMLVKAGQKFCGEHAIFDEDNQDRIPCPYDPKHTIDRRAVATHLKRCNSRLLERRWVIENINSIKGEVRSIDKIDRKARHEEIISVIHKLLSCYDSICEEIEKKQLEIPEIRDHLEQFSEISDTKRKHLIQQSSIIGHLESTKLLKNEPSACIFELGAGKAQLSYWMAKRAPSASFLLIDRSGSRNKYDNKALQENPSLNIKRLRCSIEHLNLSEVELLKGVSSLCAVCKHFCGSATDAGIRCLSNAIRGGLILDGFVLVPCCHHKSRYTEYCGQDFLEKWNMNSESDFIALRHISTWAVSGITKIHNENDLRTEGISWDASHLNDREVAQDPSPGSTSVPINGTQLEKSEGRLFYDAPADPLLPWSAKWKEEIGRRAKAVLETGRARHLALLGFSTRVIEYVSPEVTPENLLILGISQ